MAGSSGGEKVSGFIGANHAFTNRNAGYQLEEEGVALIRQVVGRHSEQVSADLGKCRGYLRQATNFNTRLKLVTLGEVMDACGYDVEIVIRKRGRRKS